MARPSGLDWSSSFEQSPNLGLAKEKQGTGVPAARLPVSQGPGTLSRTSHPTPQATSPGKTRSPQRELVCGIASKPQEDPKQRVEHSKGMWGHEGRQHSKLL